MRCGNFSPQVPRCCNRFEVSFDRIKDELHFGPIRPGCRRVFDVIIAKELFMGDSGKTVTK
jgi:hypothetical protein